MSNLRCRRQAPWLLIVASAVLGVSGCEPVREDRAIQFSSDGESVSFQHGNEGVFVADANGEEPQRIFDSADAVAVSSPLWSPTDKRLIFTAAYPADKENAASAGPPQAWDANPQGRLFFPNEIIYTCMLRGDPADGDAEPIALFQASCNHAGYVAANLAVRWRPDGRSILFIDQTEAGRHGLFEFDLKSQSRRPILAADADALVFDWSPSGRYLSVALSSGNSGANADSGSQAKPSGVWIWDVGADQWWRLPGSEEAVSSMAAASVIENLRSRQPAWDPGETRFVSVVPADVGGEQPERRILLAEMASREVGELHRSAVAVSDLHWRPDGRQLGWIEGSEPGNLRFLNLDGVAAAPLESVEVRQFVGWNAAGQRMAYLTPANQRSDAERWVLLFSRIANARDQLWIESADGAQAARLVLDQVRVTFPRWSPKRDELSLWCTYAPTHRSWLSMFLPWTLRRGDPAATLDVETGEIRWLAVNAHEETQVGHYYSLQRDYPTAWTWYDRAAKHREPIERMKLSELDRFLGGVSLHQNPTFFEYYCLTKLGRTEEAAERLRLFRESMSFDVEDAFQVLGLSSEQEDEDANEGEGEDPSTTSEPSELSQPALAALRSEWREVARFADAMLQSAYATEVYFSLGAQDDGVTFFQAELEHATNDATRLAAAISLSQLLLADGRRGEYTELVVDALLPLLMRLHRQSDLQWSDLGDLSRAPGFLKQAGTLGPGAAACLPLWSADFLSGYSSEELAALADRLGELSDQATSEDERMVADAVSLGVLAKLADSERWQAAKERLETNPWLTANSPLQLAGAQQFLDEAETLIQQLRALTSTE